MATVNLLLLSPLLLVLASANASIEKNPVFQELRNQGIKMSDGTVVKLPPPILTDGLDAAGQQAALDKVADARSPVTELVKKSYYAPIVVKVRTIRPSQGEGPAVRKIDLWFVAHGKWDILTSKDFLETALRTKEEGPNRVVLKSGTLSDKEMATRKLSATIKDNIEERFVYTTFWLFERVELSDTRFAVLMRDKDSILAAARIDPRFDKDADYPNQWRPLVRNEQAEIKPGPPHILAHAGGYAKITRLAAPTDAVLVECHIVYEEPYGWFEGANLVKQKVPLMVQEKVRTFRRKLSLASGEKPKTNSQ
jgi:hypothetical protein